MRILGIWKTVEPSVCTWGIIKKLRADPRVGGTFPRAPPLTRHTFAAFLLRLDLRPEPESRCAYLCRRGGHFLGSWTGEPDCPIKRDKPPQSHRLRDSIVTRLVPFGFEPFTAVLAINPPWIQTTVRILTEYGMSSAYDNYNYVIHKLKSLRVKTILCRSSHSDRAFLRLGLRRTTLFECKSHPV